MPDRTYVLLPMSAKERLKVPRWWLQECSEWMDAEGLTLDGCGSHLAHATGRAEPYHHMTIWKFLDGRNASRELLQAFAHVRQVPEPLAAAESPAELEWWLLGREMRALDPATYEQMLVQVRALTGILQSRHK